MNIREQIIKKYFKSWLENNCSVLKDIFDLNVTYSECYGPEYHGIDTVTTWFKEWNKRGKVLVWDIKQFIHQENITVVEWYFKCRYDGEIEEFDGVSLIEFNDNNYIVSLKEFQSKIPHYYPYSN
ncbi:nuclear transport factor 2 family protein [Clostridium beijerinckii]|uniref:nuclear transport factor 2 family protein n=1 Tax=Clostridium beijerinckii TaxID=1520 RepID=UPI0013616CEA|nr:nuclear transport factor 2 family protein [Clostridium beijerinckii]MZK48990.1 nuclear transport factor 2 family protein [Clostridium beijerinckii]MZK57365.1 nuclear transport factor 2 family protein [Clostridium beijerinckii]MZK67576.1 nuclear transport factor 2 family protein [Clostridium beijerinckii]MZK72661.1 nuclear transport factor 2 family protein [Clostridium beijerinckii]MZK82257.1 nuclear transport factor 2 family protein [Clostridium beijerinckii]